MGSAILEFMAEHNYHAQVHIMGMPDKVIEHGEQDELYNECGYDTDAIISAAMRIMVNA